MTDIIPFTHDAAATLEVSGGKGASLSRSSRSLPVPPGLIVTAEAYRSFVAPHEAAIRRILTETPEAERASEQIQALLHDAPSEHNWTQALEAQLTDLGLAHHGLAVRSSGTMEDLPGAAFAGQHDTFLGVRGTEAVAQAVRDCYGSLWNAHAMKYRERLGLAHLDASMAVVVQRMVDVTADEAAGVAFSIDPVRGDLGTVLINASFGLGETVVGGEAEVDEYLVSRAGEDRTVTVAVKPEALVSLPTGGTEEVALDPEHANRPALTAEQRAAVAALAVAAEDHFGFPQDIEWAYSGGELFLLQSRPITRVAARWTREESAERFPNPVTPLVWDLVEEGFHASLNHSFGLMGLPPFGDKWFAMRDNYIYGNQTAVELYSGRFPTHMFRDIDSLRDALPIIASTYGWVQELPVQWMRDLDTYLIGIGRLQSEPLEGKSARALWAHVLEINDLGAEYFLPNIAISLTQRTLYAGLLRMLTLGLPADIAGQDREARAQALFDQLLSQTDTKTGQVNAELWALSRAIRQDPELTEWIASRSAGRAGAAPDPTEFLAALRATSPDFARDLEAFLARHGHRELDFDAYHPTWVEAPHVVLDQLLLLSRREAQDGETANQQRAAQAEVERQVLALVPDELRYFVQEVIRLARAYTALDDLEHYQTTRLTLPMRRGLRALGESLVALEALDQADDVYFLHLATLDAALSGSGSDDDLAPSLGELRAEAVANRAAYDAAVESDPAWVYGESDDAAEAGDGDFSGTAGSPGSVEGEVFIVAGPEDFPLFPPGAILVARTTNPAWTALFYQAAGVITESGGALSHGAVTARELGLPAVMSVRGAMRQLVNGQRVRVDGTRGVVQLLDG